MKNKHLPLIVLSCSLLCGIGGAVGTACYYESQASAVAVMAEEVSSEIASSEEILSSGEASEEEEGKIAALIAELEAKYEQLKNTQVAGTTLGAIAGTVVGAIVGLFPAFLNRSNIKQTLSLVTDKLAQAEKILDAVTQLAVELKRQAAISNEKYDEAIKGLEYAGTELKSVRRELGKYADGQKEIKVQNERIEDILMTIANHTKELVASGVAEQLEAKYSKKN